MYKVFFNEYPILLNPENNNSFSGNIKYSVDIQCVDSFFELIGSIEDGKYAEQPVFNCLIEKGLIGAVIKRMTRLPAAGGIVRNTQGEILFIRRLGRWDLPKGKIEAGESEKEAALREVEEECGVHGLQIERKLISTFHIYRSPYLPKNDNWVWKETSWFEMAYTGIEPLVPQAEEGITEVRWFAESELEEVYQSTYGNLRMLLSDYLA